MPVPPSSSGAVPVGRFGSMLRMMLPWTTARRPPSLKLQTDTPVAQPSTVLLAITAPSNENSEYSATSRTSETLLPVIWMLEAELPRTAEYSQFLMRLPRTITLPARKALMALPYWPEPPGPALMSSMRLSATSVPSSPIALRRISMPLSLVPVMVLRTTLRPLASNETTAVTAILARMLPE